jgi:hypothetical protein
MTVEDDFSRFLQANEQAQVEMGVRDKVSPWVGSPFEWLMRNHQVAIAEIRPMLSLG